MASPSIGARLLFLPPRWPIYSVMAGHFWSWPYRCASSYVHPCASAHTAARMTGRFTHSPAPFSWGCPRTEHAKDQATRPVFSSWMYQVQGSWRCNRRSRSTKFSKMRDVRTAG